MNLNGNHNLNKAVAGVRVAERRRNAFSRGGYHGGKHARAYADWSAPIADADAALLGDLATLRQRSHDLVRNDPRAAGILNRIVRNVVGSGINWQAKPIVRNIGGDVDADSLAIELERVANRWHSYADCRGPVRGRLHWRDLQRLAYESYLASGEVLVVVRRKRRLGTPWRLCLQVVEADRLETPVDRITQANMRDGVELDADGGVSAYWIRRTHPGQRYSWRGGAKAKDFVRVPAFDASGRQQVFHLYRERRPDQSRGIPTLAPIIETLRNTQRYLEAERILKRVEACFGLLITSEHPEESAMGNAVANTPEGLGVEELYPGMIEYLSPGQDFKQIDPKHPGSHFEAFLKAQHRELAMATGQSYEGVAADYSETSYVGIRAGQVDERAEFVCEQQWFIRNFIAPVYDLVVEDAYLTGQIDLPEFYEYRDDYTNVSGLAPGWPYADPNRETAADSRALENGTTSRHEICARRGADYDTIVEQLEREQREQRSRGLAQNNLAEVVKTATELGVQISADDIARWFGLGGDQ